MGGTTFAFPIGLSLIHYPRSEPSNRTSRRRCNKESSYNVVHELRYSRRAITLYIPKGNRMEECRQKCVSLETTPISHTFNQFHVDSAKCHSGPDSCEVFRWARSSMRPHNRTSGKPLSYEICDLSRKSQVVRFAKSLPLILKSLALSCQNAYRNTIMSNWCCELALSNLSRLLGG